MRREDERISGVSASEYRPRKIPRAISRRDRPLGNGALHPLGPEQRRTAEAIKLSTNEDAGDFYNVRESLPTLRARSYILLAPLLLPASLSPSLTFFPSLSLSLSSAGFLFLVGPTDFFFYALLVSTAAQQRPSNGVAEPGPESPWSCKIFRAVRPFEIRR